MKLNPDRWRFWGEEVAGAISQVQWQWREDPPPRSDHRNHPSAMACADKLGAQLDDCAQMGMIEYLPDGIDANDFVSNILPLGARVKPNGSVRMLVDPSLAGVNAAMAELPCKLTSVEMIFKQVKRGAFLGKRDLLNGFFHCVLHHDARKYMGFRHPVTGRIARWVVLPQGTKQSPAVFCAVSEAAARIFKRVFVAEGINVDISVYVDDYILVCNDSHDHLIRAFDAMDRLSAELGLVFNPDKDIGKDVPTHTIVALGLEIDSVHLQMQLPRDKRDSYLQCVESFVSEFKGQSSCHRKALETLVGKLVFTCKVCRWGFLFVQSLFDALYPVTVGGVTPKFVALGDHVWHDLLFWQQSLGLAFDSWLESSNTW